MKLKTIKMFGACLCGLAMLIPTVPAQSSAPFTYQGRLNNGGSPANGTYDLTFTLFDSATNGNLIAGPQTNVATAVNNGLFTVTLDFSNTPFATGAPRWLEIGVCSNDNSFAFGRLSPRQSLTATPYSTYASSAGVANGLASGAVIQAQSLNVGTGNSESGNGVTIAGGSGNTVSADFGTIAGGQMNTASSNSAAIGGGSGNTASGDHTVVAGGEANTASGDHSFVGGGIGNFAEGSEDVVAGGVSNTVAGDPSFIGSGALNVIGTVHGLYNDDTNHTGLNSWIGSGQGNNIQANYAGIGGGANNHINAGATFSFIGGGDLNAILNYSIECVISGGTGNAIWYYNGDATIAGGYYNTIQSYSTTATISGGQHNLIQTNGYAATIAGGYANTIGSNAMYSVIGGGYVNSILPFSQESTIGGGSGNSILSSISNTIIGGGSHNTVQNFASTATIAGGQNNTIQTNAYNSTIGGGDANRIQTGADDSVIAGGNGNSITAPYASIGGGYTNTAGNYSVVGGGQNNSGTGDHSFIGGGVNNNITQYSSLCGVDSGLNNGASGLGSWIGGGESNNISYSTFGVIAGGYLNSLQNSTYESVISGGANNTIQSGAFNSTIAGGLNNNIVFSSSYSDIGGGAYNLIGDFISSTNYSATNITYATISGGASNQVVAPYGTVPGGQQAVSTNYAQLAYSSGQFQNPGDSQYSLYVLRGTTATNGIALLYLDGISQEISLPTNRACVFQISLIGLDANHNAIGYQIRGAANGTGQEDDWNNDPTIQSIYLNSTITGYGTEQYPVSLSQSYTIRPIVSVSNGKLHVQVTSDGNPMRWTATVQTTEVSY